MKILILYDLCDNKVYLSYEFQMMTIKSTYNIYMLYINEASEKKKFT